MPLINWMKLLLNSPNLVIGLNKKMIIKRPRVKRLIRMSNQQKKVNLRRKLPLQLLKLKSQQLPQLKLPLQKLKKLKQLQLQLILDLHHLQLKQKKKPLQKQLLMIKKPIYPQQVEKLPPKQKKPKNQLKAPKRTSKKQKNLLEFLKKSCTLKLNSRPLSLPQQKIQLLKQLKLWTSKERKERKI